MRIPLDLLYKFLVTNPFNQGCTRSVNAPKVDELTLASDSHVIRVLPFYLHALELGVDVAVVEDGYLSTVRVTAVPDIDLTHETSCGDKMVCLIAKLALHKTIVELFRLLDIDSSLTVHSPHSGYVVR